MFVSHHGQSRLVASAWSEWDGFVLVVIDRLADQVVPRAQPGDQPRLLGERAIGRQHAHRDAHPIAIVGEPRIVTLATGVLPTPELLSAAPGLKVSRQGLIQSRRVGFTNVDGLAGAVVLDLAEDIHTGL